MHDGADAEVVAQPQIKRQIVMRRHQIGVVIAALWIDVVAARRLDADRDVPELMQSEPERSIHDMRIVGGAAPSRHDGIPDAFGQGREHSFIVGHRP